MNKIKLFVSVLATFYSFSLLHAAGSTAVSDGQTLSSPTSIQNAPRIDSITGNPTSTGSITVPIINPLTPILNLADYYASPTGVDTNSCIRSASPCSLSHVLSLVPVGGVEPKVIALASGNYPPISIVNKNVILRGKSAMNTRIDGSLPGVTPLTVPVHVGTSSTVILENISVVGGKTIVCGGGISNQANLKIKNVAVLNNVSDNGGGICNQNGASLGIEDSSITSNIARADGAGVYNEGQLNILNSTVSANWANGSGGGIYTASSSFKMAFTTLSYNAANVDRVGPSSEKAGGLYIRNGSTVYLKNNLMAANVIGIGTSGGSESRISDCSMGGDEVGFNPSGQNEVSFRLGCFVGNEGEVHDYKLGLLFYNGGSTVTQALSSESDAIDVAADCTDIDGNVVDHDQRGVPRNTTQYGACDVGAFEATPILAAVYVSSGTEYAINSMNLGSAPINRPTTNILRIKNIGQAPLNASAVFSPSEALSVVDVTPSLVPSLPEGVVRSCSSVLPGQTCLLGIRFAPTQVRAYTSVLTFAGNNPSLYNSLVSVALTGNGVEAVEGGSSASYSLSSSPGPDVTVPRGTSLPIQITVNPSTFTSTPVFSLEGTQPNNLVVNWGAYNPTTRQVTLTLSAGSDTALTSTPAALQIRAIANGETVNLPLNLTVSEAGSGPAGPTAPLGITLSATSASVIQGQVSNPINVTLNRASFAGVVQLSVEGDNLDGVTAGFSPNALTGNASTMTLTVAPSAVVGSRNIRVVASSGSTVVRSNFTLNIVSSTGANPGTGGNPPVDGVDGSLGRGGSGGCTLSTSTSASMGLSWLLMMFPLIGLRMRRK